MQDYDPRPLDTAHVRLGPDLEELIERLARNAHDVWARKRLDEGWRYGPRRDDAKKENPTLVPYEQLPESEKEYDRAMVLQAVKAILASGYRIEKA